MNRSPKNRYRTRHSPTSAQFHINKAISSWSINIRKISLSAKVRTCKKNGLWGSGWYPHNFLPHLECDRPTGLLFAIRSDQRCYKRLYLDYELFSLTEGEQIRVITLIYNHEQRGFIWYWLTSKHENAKIITSTVQIHSDAKNYFKIDVVHESAPDLRSFAEKMIGAERSFSSSDVCHAGADSWHSGAARVPNTADLTN